MNTLKELQESKFACFNHLDAADKSAQIKSVEYIERMAALTQIDISKVNLFDIFGNGTQKDRLITGKADTNKRLMELEKNSLIKTRELSTQEEAILKVLAKVNRERQADKIREYQGYVNGSLRDAGSYYRSFEERLANAASYQRQITAMEGKTDMGVIEEIRKVMLSTFWEIHEGPMPESYFYFKTRSDIILTQKNLAAGIDLRVNMGKYLARLEVARSRVVLLAHSENLFVRDYYHPYVSSAGDICWGNAAGQAGKLLVASHYNELFQLLAGLLTTYTPEATPYQALESFQVESDKLNKSGAPRGTPEDWCSDCNRHEDDCECAQCSICDERYVEGERECDCCLNCDNVEGECTCCGNCGSSNIEECGCCHECDRTERAIRREGHRRTCSAFVAPEEPDEVINEERESEF